MTCEQKYEALTTVEAVQKAFADGRAVECSYGTEAWRIVRPKDDGYDAAYFISKGVQYRAPAASVGDAPSDAVADFAELPKIDNAEARAWAKEELSKPLNITTVEIHAPPAAPVVSETMVERAANAIWAVCNQDIISFPACLGFAEEALEAALSVPATDDKAPAVDAEPVIAEVVGKVHRTDDGFDVEWLLEGGIHAVGVDGETYLYTIDIPVPDDGAIELYAAPTSPHDVDAGEKAPRHNLPTWGECADRVANSDYVAKRKAEGGYGEDPDGMYANALHRFIYEYDDADKFKSGWFMYRLQLVVDELTSRPHDVDAVLVDEAMVERALAAHAAEPKEYQHEIDYRVYQRDAMRAALTAALRKPGEA